MEIEKLDLDVKTYNRLKAAKDRFFPPGIHTEESYGGGDRFLL